MEDSKLHVQVTGSPSPRETKTHTLTFLKTDCEVSPVIFVNIYEFPVTFATITSYQKLVTATTSVFKCFSKDASLIMVHPALKGDKYKHRAE